MASNLRPTLVHWIPLTLRSWLYLWRGVGTSAGTSAFGLGRSTNLDHTSQEPHGRLQAPPLRGQSPERTKDPNREATRIAVKMRDSSRCLASFSLSTRAKRAPPFLRRAQIKCGVHAVVFFLLPACAFICQPPFAETPFQAFGTWKTVFQPSKPSFQLGRRVVYPFPP